MILNELRRSSAVLPRQSTAEQLKLIAKQMGTKNLFVTFTTVEKVGINPGSTYATPLGIYTYPLAYVIKNIHQLGNSFEIRVPFAGKAPFISVLKSTGNLVDLADEETCLQYAKKILGSDEHPEDIIPDSYNKYPDPVTFWSASLYMANGESESPKTSVDIAKRWNRVFRNAGIDGVVDSEGKGIIHPNEPTQAVFFHTGAFRVIKRITNNQNSGSPYKVNKHDREYDRSTAFTLIRSTAAFKQFKETVGTAIINQLEDLVTSMDNERNIDLRIKPVGEIDSSVLTAAVDQLLSNKQVIAICKKNSVDVDAMRRPLMFINTATAANKIIDFANQARENRFTRYDHLLKQVEQSGGSFKELQDQYGSLKSARRALATVSNNFERVISDFATESLNTAIDVARTDI